MSSQAVLRGRNKKKSKKDGGNPADLVAPTKEEKEVAKYLRFNMKTKEGVCMGNQVAYFAGSKAVDLLMASKWASATKKDDSVLFPSRQVCVDYCHTLLEKDLFRRVLRIRKAKKSDKTDKKEGKKSKKSIKDDAAASEKAENANPSSAEETVAKEKDSKDESETNNNKETDKDKNSKPKKPRKPAKLEPHEEQVFVDGGEADEALFVWIFDPVSTKTYLLGITVIIGAIAACLYPLWPMQLRLGIYYVCLGLIGLLGLLILLAVIRFCLFVAVWCGTVGKRHFWLYPNLFEDCGFFESFRPMYSLTTPDANGKKSKKAAAEKKDTAATEETTAKGSVAAKLSATDETEKLDAAETTGREDEGHDSAGESESSAARDYEVVHHSDFPEANKNSNSESEDEQ